MYYQYDYTKGTYRTISGLTSPASANGFQAIATGDLDGDTATSNFVLQGNVEGNGQLNRSTQVYIYEEFE